MLSALVGAAWAQSASSGVMARALGSANLRAQPSINATIVGAIDSAASHPVIGRSELYPWLLLGDAASAQPIGWVYETLVAVSGNVLRVPFSAQMVSQGQPTVAATQARAASEVDATATPIPYAVYGTARGEINVRHGPGIDYPRAGVGFAGERFEITGYHTQYPWLRVSYAASSNGYAWIARDLLDINGDVFATAPLSQARYSPPAATATPPVVRAADIGGVASAPLSPAFASLGESLWNLLLDSGFDPQTSRFGAVFVMDLSTRQALSFGDEYAFSGTSLNKVAILAKLYETLNSPPAADMATDILNTMICSENAATNRLLSAIGNGSEWLGAQAVSEFLARQGFADSFLTAPFTTIGTPEPPPFPVVAPQTSADQVKALPDPANQLTVADIGGLLASIHDCAYGAGGASNALIEPRECRQMLHVMSNNTVDALLKTGAPANTRVAHKHGWIPDTHGNAALFFTPGADYVMAMLLFQPEWLNFQESLPLFTEASRRVYNHFNPQTPYTDERDWTIPDVNECNYFGDALVADVMQWQWDG